MPGGVWQRERRVAWTGVNGLGAGPCQLHTAPGLNFRVLEAIEASRRVCGLFFFFWFVFLKAISIFECTPSLPITSGSCYSLIWIIGLKTVCSKAF